MSSKVISVKFSVDGIDTDATSMKFNDPTGTYGVRRVSNQQIVLAAGTDFNHDGVGRYSYELTGLVAGVDYEYWIERLYDGKLNHYNRIFTAPGDYYVTQAFMEERRGSTNVVSWSDLDGDGIVNTATVEAAIEYAQDQIDRRLALRYIVPLQGDANGAAITNEDERTLRRWAEIIATYELYRSRGAADEDNPLKLQRDEVIAEIEKFSSIGGEWKLDAYQRPRSTMRSTVVNPLEVNPVG